MSKRQIIAAAARKGITFDEIYFNRQCVTPEEIVSAWEIRLSEESEEAIATADPDFHNFVPDVWNTAMALEWVASLPDLLAAAQQPGAQHGQEG